MSAYATSFHTLPIISSDRTASGDSVGWERRGQAQPIGETVSFALPPPVLSTPWPLHGSTWSLGATPSFGRPEEAALGNNIGGSAFFMQSREPQPSQTQTQALAMSGVGTAAWPSFGSQPSMGLFAGLAEFGTSGLDLVCLHLCSSIYIYINMNEYLMVLCVCDLAWGGG